MKIGVTMAFNHLTPVPYIAEAAQLVESMGFHSIWVPEHVLFFPSYESSYPYSEDGRIPGEPEGTLDPFSALVFAAAHTSTIRLATGICLVPQRQPVYTAKMVADLDYLSQGRVDFGVGIGWLKEEFDALQMPFDKRAARTREYVEAMRALWTPGQSEFHGETVQIAPCHFNPKPVQQGSRFAGPPVYFGGESEPALRRVADLGDGWYGFNMSPDQFKERLSRLHELLEAAGRAKNEIDLVVGKGYGIKGPEEIAAFAEAGASQLVLGLFASDLKKLETRATRLRDMCASAVG